MEAPVYNEAYCEQFRKHSVNTKYSTLMKLRPLLKELGLSELLKGGEVKTDSKSIISAVLTVIEEKNSINEFCQIVTGKQDDFTECDAGEIFWIINDFFTAYWWQMPPSWRAGIVKSVAYLQEWGKQLLPVKENQESPTG